VETTVAYGGKKSPASEDSSEGEKKSKGQILFSALPSRLRRGGVKGGKTIGGTWRAQ